MNKKKPLPRLVKFMIFTMITVFIWIGFDVYRAVTEEPEISVAPEIAAPLNPTLDTDTLAIVSRRLLLSETEIGDTEITLPLETPEEVEEQEIPEIEVEEEPLPLDELEELEEIEEENGI